MERLLSLSPAAIQDFLDAMPVPVAWFRIDTGECQRVNRAFEETLGYRVSNLTSWDHWSSCFSRPEQKQKVISEWLRQTSRRHEIDSPAGLRIDPMELCLLHLDGHELTVLHSGVVLPTLNAALAICIDITTRKQLEQQLTETARAAREREVLYPLLLELTREMIVLTDVHGDRQFVSPGVLPLLGWTQEEYTKLHMEDVVHPDDLAQTIAARTRCLAGASEEQVCYRTRKKDGTYLWVDATASCHRDPLTNALLGYVAMIRDGSVRQAEEAKRAEREAVLEQQARYDQLTGVANRHVLYSSLSDEARRQTRRTQELSLLLIDIDHFKLFNDRYGHLEGDKVLRQVAQILQSSVSRVADLLARFGGEEFVLLLPMTDGAGAEAIARRILAALTRAAIPHENSPFGHVTVSIGVANWPATLPLDRDELLLVADKALYAAKKNGRNTFAARQCALCLLEVDAFATHRGA